jgi:hypothetical protein
VALPKQKKQEENLAVDFETTCFPCHTHTVTSYYLVKKYEFKAHIQDIAQGSPLHS